MSDLAVFLIVVGLRFGIPLLIPRFPLPAIIAALVIDAADQTIFQNHTDLDLAGYQGYDKALDIYYLSIAYVSTMRNWVDPFAVSVARFLWYYRLVGVALFELLEYRWLLLVFPNTFEYFFIAYEAVRLWWDPTRLDRRRVVIMAACIWIFVKLPQEWWIHVAQLDFTDFMKEDVFGVTVDTSWGTALGDNLWFVALMVALAVGVGFAIRAIRPRLPDPDWGFTVDVDAHLPAPVIEIGPSSHVLWRFVLEKVALLALITIIFSQFVPDLDASPFQLTWATGLFVIGSAVVATVLARFGVSWSSTLGQFAGTLAVGASVVGVYLWLLRRSDEPINEAATVFFVVLLSLVIALFDRFRVQGDSRRAALGRPTTP